MINKLILYNFDLSPPVRTVKIVAKLIGVDLELRHIDLMAGDHLKESFIKLNPQHTIPTLIDGDFVIWESHAICAYLVDKYAKDDKLYPKELHLRAKCNQRLFFDVSTLFERLRDAHVQTFQVKEPLPQDKLVSTYDAYNFLEAFLATDTFLVGNQLTIADIPAAVTTLALELYIPIPSDKYPKVRAWLDRVKETAPVLEEINGEALEKLRGFLSK